MLKRFFTCNPVRIRSGSFATSALKGIILSSLAAGLVSPPAVADEPVNATTGDAGKPAVQQKTESEPGKKKKKAARHEPSFPVSGKVSRTIQKVTGLNFLAGVIASQVAKSVIAKKVGGKVKVRIKTFSLTDLLAGKVRSVSCKLAGPSIKGVKLGQISADSQEPIWLDFRNKRHIQLKSPILVSVKAALSQTEASQALESPGVASSLRGLNLDLPGLGSQQLQVIKPRVEFQKDMIRIEATLVTQGAAEATGVPIVISGRLKLRGDNLLVMEDMQVTGADIVEPEKFAAFVEELLNPLVDLRRLDRKDHAFRLTTVDMNDSGISGEGKLLLAPKADSKIAQKNQLSK